MPMAWPPPALVPREAEVDVGVDGERPRLDLVRPHLAHEPPQPLGFLLAIRDTREREQVQGQVRAAADGQLHRPDHVLEPVAGRPVIGGVQVGRGAVERDAASVEAGIEERRQAASVSEPFVLRWMEPRAGRARG